MGRKAAATALAASRRAGDQWLRGQVIHAFQAFPGSLVTDTQLSGRCADGTGLLNGIQQTHLLQGKGVAGTVRCQPDPAFEFIGHPRVLECERCGVILRVALD